MAYNISLTSGQDLVTVADGTTDSNYTSLTLIGKNFAGYGDFLNENFVHLLENFANSTEPPNALEGQVWWDKANKVLKVKNTSGWKSVSSSTSSSTVPPNATIGDLWWDSANGQLKVFAGGTSWVTIGPAYTATQGQTGVIADSIVETGGVQSHVIVKFMVNNVCVGVMSKDPTFTVTSLPGFSTINPGLNLAAPLTSGGTSYKYHGDAFNALNLGGTPAVDFLQRNKANITIQPFSVQHQGGIAVGPLGDLTLSSSANSVEIASTIAAKDMALRVNIGGVPTTLLTLSPTNGLTATTPDSSSPLTAVATKGYVDSMLIGPNSIGLHKDGTNQITGDITPYSTALNFGSLSSPFANVYSTNFVGTASNSLQLGGQDFSKYVRTDVATSMSAPLSTTSNNGLTLGASGDFTIDVTSTPNSVNLKSNTAGKSVILSVKVGANPVSALTVDGATGLATVVGSPSVTNGIATKGYVDGVISGGGSLGAVSGNIVPNANNAYSIGLSNMKFTTVYATTFAGNASTANYADLAERFAADKAYAPGTVVELGGVNEITAAMDDLSDNVFGVISTQAAYLMNAGAGNDLTHPPIAMQGRVPVRVIGAVRKGDRLVSAGNGLARAATRSEITSFNVIGRALQNKTSTGEGNVEAIVKLNS